LQQVHPTKELSNDFSELPPQVVQFRAQAIAFVHCYSAQAASQGKEMSSLGRDVGVQSKTGACDLRVLDWGGTGRTVIHVRGVS